MKPEVIKNLLSKQLKKVNILENICHPWSFFAGNRNKKLLVKCKRKKNNSKIVK